MKADSTAERWHEVDAIFTRAIDLPAEEREGFVLAEGGEDSDLVQAVLRLVRSHARAESFLESSIESLAADVWPDALANWSEQQPDMTGEAAAGDVSDRSGERVGPWLLVRLLGRGGMASVYLAERADGQFDQQVALKLLRRGLDTDDLVRRFLAERQILSSLNHPNIARLLDGGATPDGLPYLALAHVDGLPITEYCKSQNCTIEQRLRLFMDVGRAVQYAHANLVVHRDLKPSNILVTPDGTVKLLDFGIAKLLDPDAASGDSTVTHTGFRALTPEYASPEQVRGDPITTASDVYQLGVLLYRLLTGQRPYEVSTSSAAAMAEVITTSVPPRPSTYNKRLRGDVNVIILKALRKEPSRRYGSAIEMVEDVRRHLDGHPISARKESRTYRLGKFVKRNAWALTAAATLVLLLSVYGVTLVRYGRELETERNLAQQEAAKAEEVSRFLVELYRSPDPYAEPGSTGGKDITMREALLDGVQRARTELEYQPVLQATLLHNIGEILYNLDVPMDALPVWEETLALDRSLYGEESAEAAASLWYVAELTAVVVDRDSSITLFQKQLDLNTRLFGSKSLEVAQTLESLGVTSNHMGRLEESVAYLEAAVEICRSSAEEVSAEIFASALGHLGDAYSELGRSGEALETSREALAIVEPALGPDHPSTAILRIKFARSLKDAGETGEAATNYHQALPVLERNLGAEHVQYLNSLNNYAILLQELDRLDEAEVALRELLEIRMRKGGESSELTIASIQNLGSLLNRQGQYREADSLVSRAFELYDQLYGRDHYLTAFPLLTLSEIRLATGDFEGAAPAAALAAEILKATLPAGHYATSVARCRHGRALHGMGRTNEALNILRPAVQMLEAAEIAAAGRFADECRQALDTIEAALD